MLISLGSDSASLFERAKRPTRSRFVMYGLDVAHLSSSESSRVQTRLHALLTRQADANEEGVEIEAARIC